MVWMLMVRLGCGKRLPGEEADAWWLWTFVKSEGKHYRGPRKPTRSFLLLWWLLCETSPVKPSISGNNKSLFQPSVRRSPKYNTGLLRGVRNFHEKY